jgi:AraC family transcriptional regulator
MKPTAISQLLLTSAGTNWSGFPLAVHRIAPRGACADYTVRRPTVLLCTAGRTTVAMKAADGGKRLLLTPPKLCLIDAGYEVERLSWSGAHEMLILELCPFPLQRVMGDEDRLGNVEIRQQFAIEDRQASALVSAMLAEVEAGCPAGPLYGESLSLALTAYLLNRYPATPPKRETRMLKLSPLQLARLRAYIQTHLSRDLTLAELAGVVRLSTNHFTVLFKNAVGLTPHQYVLRERIRAGMRLLGNGRISIVEVALELGFSSQSHFTTVFRRATGLTPRQYQQKRGWSFMSSGAASEDAFIPSFGSAPTETNREHLTAFGKF